MESAHSNSLCTHCGLCCNGVIFARGQLQPEDDLIRLRALGLALLSRKSSSNPQKFRQPCTAFEGCRCRIYAERPTYCREFECALLKQAQAGAIDPPAALKVIRQARRRVARVEALLLELGDADSSAALGQRFRRTQKRFESGTPAPHDIARFGELTLAVHDLNLLLSRRFYPGESGRAG